MLVKNEIINNFSNVFKKEPTDVYYSPGRVNLIGEHIDYHGGYVFPCALSIGIYAGVSLRDDSEIHLYSEGYSSTPLVLSLTNLEKSRENSWANYVLGVFSVLKSEGYNIEKGLNLYLYSTMPPSGGLSSSSALELLIIKILNDLFNLGIERNKMAILGQKVENNYIGVKSGIMDQFVIANGKKDHALLIDTETLNFDYVPLELGEYTLLIANTNKKRNLSGSKYNERYDETMAALKIIKTQIDIKTLTQLYLSQLRDIKPLLDEVKFRRVRHIISEQNRTINAAQLLSKGDIKSFALLLNDSHKSLKEDYEVTGVELDTLTELMRKHGAIGARMTGAGFGGCAIGIAEKSRVALLKTKVIEEYTKKIGYPPTFFETTSEDGTSKI